MDYQAAIKATMRTEMNAIQALLENVQSEYSEVAHKIYECQGKIVFMGIGKSGHIAKKLAASFASLGIPSFFVHASESMHGDLGMIEEKDIVILISNSGNTQEVIQVLPHLKRIHCTSIAFSGNATSVLAKECELKLIYPKYKEADENQLAPTSSTTQALVLGDAIACAVSKAKAFQKEDFHKFHPGGALGAQLSK